MHVVVQPFIPRRRCLPAVARRRRRRPACSDCWMARAVKPGQWSANARTPAPCQHLSGNASAACQPQQADLRAVAALRTPRPPVFISAPQPLDRPRQAVAGNRVQHSRLKALRQGNHAAGVGEERGGGGQKCFEGAGAGHGLRHSQDTVMGWQILRCSPRPRRPNHRRSVERRPSSRPILPTPVCLLRQHILKRGPERRQAERVARQRAAHSPPCPTGRSGWRHPAGPPGQQ